MGWFILPYGMVWYIFFNFGLGKLLAFPLGWTCYDVG